MLPIPEHSPADGHWAAVRQCHPVPYSEGKAERENRAIMFLPPQLAALLSHILEKQWCFLEKRHSNTVIILQNNKNVYSVLWNPTFLALSSRIESLSLIQTLWNLRLNNSVGVGGPTFLSSITDSFCDKEKMSRATEKCPFGSSFENQTLNLLGLSSPSSVSERNIFHFPVSCWEMYSRNTLLCVLLRNVFKTEEHLVVGTDAPCNLGFTVLECLGALGGSGPPPLVDPEPLLPLWLCGGTESRGICWVKQGAGGELLPGLMARAAPARGGRPTASSHQRGGKKKIQTQLPAIIIKGILHACIFFLREKLCWFRLPWFLVSLVTSQYGVGDERWGEGRRSQKDRGQLQRSWARQMMSACLFSQEKEQKEWMFLGKECGCVLYPWCFIIQKGEKIIQQN